MLQEFNQLLEQCESDEIYENGIFMFIDIMGVIYKPVELLGVAPTYQVKLQNVSSGSTEILSADYEWVIEYTKKMRDFVKGK